MTTPLAFKALATALHDAPAVRRTPRQGDRCAWDCGCRYAVGADLKWHELRRCPWHASRWGVLGDAIAVASEASEVQP